MSTCCAILLTCVLTTAGGGGGPGQPPVKVDELLPGAAGFIVLRNVSAEEVYLDGWTVRACSGTGSEELAALPAGSSIPGGGHYLIAGHAFAGTVDHDLVVHSINGTGTMLLDEIRKRVDGLGFVPDSPCRENHAAVQCPGLSLGRDREGTDTDDNRADFTCQPPLPDLGTNG